MLQIEVIRQYLNEGTVLGAREFYFTGGEPFLHPQVTDIVKLALDYGPTTVLSNGTLITGDIAQTLSRISCQSKYTLELRISLESYEENENDRIRGKGSFKGAIKGIRALQQAGFSPIITTAEWSKYGILNEGTEENIRSLFNFFTMPEVRLKRLPLVLLGRCSELIRPYQASERVTGRCFDGYPMDNLQCTTSRIVTDKGVFVCPVLINDPKAWMGCSLKESMRPYVMESPACYTCRTSGLICKNDDVPVLKSDTSGESKNTMRRSVHTFYAIAADKPQKELCCPASYNPADVSHIPQEILDISYGCGSPVTLANIGSGEYMLDLGSGGGVDCFIAAKSVGKTGRIIGVDMTDEMLMNANAAREIVARNLGFDNVRFVKGFLEEIPLRDDCVDLVTSNCVVNLSSHKEKVFQEIFRVLKSSGRFVISDIVSERDIPLFMRQNKKLWSECISGAITETEFIDITKAAGFYGLEIVNRNLYREAEGFRFYSVTVRGYKYRKLNECKYIGQYAIYKGPGKSISDDDGHTYPVGVPIEICTDTAWKLSNPPYKGMFLLSDVLQSDREPEKSCSPECC